MTAITAIAPAIAATQAETAVAVATVVAFGTSSMLAYPVLAHNYLPFEFSEQVGLFLGIAIHDTAQVSLVLAYDSTPCTIMSTLLEWNQHSCRTLHCISSVEVVSFPTLL